MITFSKEHAPVIHTMTAFASKALKDTYQHLLISRQNNQLVITGSDLDSTMTATFPNDGDDETYLIHAKKLSDILKTVGGNLSLSESKNNSFKGELKSGKSKYAVSLLDAAMYALPKPQDTLVEFTLDAATFKNVTQLIAYAMTEKDPRPYCNGMFIRIHNGTLTFAATDGQRIATFDLAYDDTSLSTSFVLPRKMVYDLQKLMQNTVTVRVTKTYVEWAWDNIVYTTKVIDTNYPDFSRVLPKTALPTIDIPRADFLEAIIRTNVITSDKFRGAKATFSENNVTVQCFHNDEIATADVDISYTEAARETGFNIDYMKDVFEHVKGDTIQWAWADRDAIYLTCQEIPHFKYLLMPMRV